MCMCESPRRKVQIRKVEDADHMHQDLGLLRIGTWGFVPPGVSRIVRDCIPGLTASDIDNANSHQNKMEKQILVVCVRFNFWRNITSGT